MGVSNKDSSPPQCQPRSVLGVEMHRHLDVIGGVMHAVDILALQQRHHLLVGV